MAHISLHRQTINGPFPTPASVDENWTKLQSGHNSHDDRIVTVEGKVEAIEEFIDRGVPCEFFAARYSVTAAPFLIVPFPDADLWDELEITYQLKNLSNAALIMRTSIDGGATFDSGATDYRQWNDATAVGATTEIQLGTTQTDNAATANCGRLLHSKPLGTEYSQFRAEGMYGATRYEVFAIRNIASNAPNALRFAMTSGNMTGRVFVKRIKYPSP